MPILALVACALGGATACGDFGESAAVKAEDPTAPPGNPNVGGPGAPPEDGGGPKAPAVVDGTPATSELTEAFGIFVTPNGVADAPGTREHPLLTISAGIEAGRKVGKRVYVCTGTFHESIELADSISIIGGFDCSNPKQWRAGSPRTRIESPSSPAIRAKDIVTATRLDALDIIAADATAPSGSSFGLIAGNSSALVIANSKIKAGNAGGGDSGINGVQLVNGPAINGASASPEHLCVFSTAMTIGPCTYNAFFDTYTKPSGVSGGFNTCSTNAALNGGYGAAGGAGALKVMPEFAPRHQQVVPVVQQPSIPAEAQSGSSALGLGTFSVEGYSPKDGTPGDNGKPGQGGWGGAGQAPSTIGKVDGSTWVGQSGSGGGAGGCPGLAGSPGKGGGASVAAFLSASPITFDGTDLVAGNGGSGGRGTIGSEPTNPGVGGANPEPVAYPTSSGGAGSRGGLAGISGHGAPGPSLGIVHAGPAPTLKNTNVLPGNGGAAVDARVEVIHGITRTIPTSPAGLSKAVHGI